ncbi:PREDICTED: uncharacterized protein LOC105452203 isoform X2 [Wasmannia auropunctata]|uniref:uncharacterized protein LOC105452203 isoform X2 n=1 Tax=Wasmannia auropunctata TaxID=64793 RepID=UPI0005ED5A57|nr:PREDICTED: uncharacterized protein LOC105452203 isoform X2 [Wasmannia auropunctata]
MGKSSHKSRKRRRSSSGDRLAALEEKVLRLISLMKHREGSDIELASEISVIEEGAVEPRPAFDIEYSLAAPACQEGPSESLAAPASQEGPIDPHFSDPVGSEDATSPTSPPVMLTDLPVTSAIEENSADALTQELFGSDLEGIEARPWHDLVVSKWQHLTRNGLEAERRDSLLKKYSLSEAVAFLKAPKLNPECRSALKSNSIVKRDDFNARDQDQVGFALCAFGEAISDFLSPDIQHLLAPEARSAVAKVNDGALILADLFYRLSLSRRAQIKPALNQLAKNTADALPADVLLFGSSFGDEMKKATTMERSSKDIIRTPLIVPKKLQQPFKQSSQTTLPRSGNSRAPVSKLRQVTARTGASSSGHRSFHRPRSRSRRR